MALGPLKIITFGEIRITFQKEFIFLNEIPSEKFKNGESIGIYDF